MIAQLTALLILLMGWTLPVNLPPWVSWHKEILVFSAVLLFAWQALVSLGKKDSRADISFPGITLPVFALVGVALLQTASGMITFVGDALVLTLYFLGCVACMVLGRATSVDRKTYNLLASVILLGAFLSAVVAFAQTFELWGASAWISRMPALRRPGGNLVQPNQLATLLLMGLASLVFLYETKKLSTLSSTLFALTLLAGVAITESRTGALSFLTLTTWWFAKRKLLRFRLSPWIVSAAVVGFLSLFWAWPLLIDAVLQTTESGSSSRLGTSVGTRLLVWPQLIEAIFQRPWFGWGLGQVSTALNSVVHAYASSENFTYAHNIVLDLALGIGLPLTVLVLLLTSVWLWRRIRAVTQLAPWYCLAIISPVAVHSMLEFPFAYAYFLFPVMFALGALDGVSGAKPAFCLGVKPVAAMLLITTAVMVWSVVEYLEIEEDFRVMRFEVMRIGTTPQDYQRPRVILLTQLDALLNAGRIVPKSGMPLDELDLARKVALRFPWPATQNRYALSLALNGNPNEAIRQLRVVRALHGEQNYSQIKANWVELAATKYPQLRDLTLSL